jgi:hypothetical protein
MVPYNLNLQIDHLVLHGFPAGDLHLIHATIQQELTRLFTEQGVPPSLMQGGGVNQVNGGSFEMTVGAKADAIGAQIAQSIYGGMGG